MSAVPTVPATGEAPDTEPATGNAPDTKPAASGRAAVSLGDAAPSMVAIVCLLGFGALILYLLGRTITANELEWTRAVYLLNGVEAVAFAAAGFLFGKEVHRKQAEKAEEQAAQATDRAQSAQAQAATAQKVATELKAKTDAIKAWADAKTAQRRPAQPIPPPISAAPVAPGAPPPGARREGPPPTAGAAPATGQVDVDELQTMIHELFG